MKGRASNLRRFLRYVRPHRGRLVTSTLVGILKYNLPLIFPWILKDLIDNLLKGNPSLTGLNLDQLMACSVVLFIIYAAICFLRTHLFDRLNYAIITDIRMDLFRHLQRLPLEFFQNRQTGAISSRLFTDVNQAQSFIWLVGTNLFMDVTSIFTISFVVFSMDWKLGLVAYCTLPFYFLLQKRLGERMRHNWKEARNRMDILEGGFHETVSGISEVKKIGRAHV